MGHLYKHIQGHIAGIFRPGLLPTGREPAGGGEGGAFEMSWGDGTLVMWADGTATEWSNA